MQRLYNHTPPYHHSAGNSSKLQRVNLTVSPKGIEIIDRVTSESLQQISIYRICNCSADPTHGNVFAFTSSPRVASGEESSSSDEFAAADPDSSALPLTCHVFVCSKRKVAQSISLTVAKSFDRAFETWKSISHRRMIFETRKGTDAKEYSLVARPDVLKEGEMVHGEGGNERTEEDEEKMMNLLIDLNADLTDIRKSYLQNTWVSFEESEHLISNLQKNAICL